MKRALTLCLSVALLVLCTSCGKNTSSASAEDHPEAYVTLGKYTRLTVDWNSSEALTLLSETCSSMDLGTAEPVTGRVTRDGDTVTIDYTGYLGGQPFSGGSATNYRLTLGSGKLIPGFESGLIGKNAGDSVTLSLIFPESYSQTATVVGMTVTLAGKAVTFTVKIHAISRLSYSPEETASAKEKALPTLLLRAVKGASRFRGIPAGAVDSYVNETVNYYKNYARYHGYDFDEAALRTQAAGQAESEIQTQLVVRAIAKAEKLTVSVDDYTAYVKREAAAATLDTETYITYYGGEGRIRLSMLYDLVGQFLIDHMAS